MLLACAIALGVTGLGLVCVRSAPPLARWLAFALSVGFAIVATATEQSSPRTIDPRAQSVEVRGDDLATRTALLSAAARSGPTTGELTIRWQAPFAIVDADVGKALGARAVAEQALPLSPDDVHVRAVSNLAVDRPAEFEIYVDGFDGELQAQWIVRRGERELLREPCSLSQRVTTVPFQPVSAGRHECELQFEVDGHRVRSVGSFDVAPPAVVLVVEPGDVVGAALRAQGVRVRSEPALPADWAQHHTIVLGELLPNEQQQQLVDAVVDGLGLFVLAPAFGPITAPLRTILPVRPLPMKDQDGTGGGAASDPTTKPPKDPPRNDPPRDPPTDDEIGDTGDAKPISPEPIDVDKHAIAMVLLVDRSGSMGTVLVNGRSKMSYAKTSALRTAQTLDVGDAVGIVTFGDKYAGRVEMEMQPATANATVREGIAKLAHAPLEGTFLLSGLRLARDLLRKHDAAVKHIVVLTDGEYRMSEQLALRREADLMRKDDKVTLSMISIVDSITDPQFMDAAELLTRDGGGHFLPIEDASEVPVMVSAEVTRALSRVGRKPKRSGDDENAPPPEVPPKEPEQPPEQDEPPPTPPVPEEPKRLPVHAVAESPLLAPDPVEWPTLAAARHTEAPFESRVLLVAGDEGWPLLAYANRGLGRIGAFAADLLGDDGAEFRSADAFPAWVAQWVSATTPARERAQARDVVAADAVEPPAPLPDHVQWLTQVGSVEPVLPAEASVAVALSGREALDQSPSWARWLFCAVLLLAIAERLLIASGLRRGRG